MKNEEVKRELYKSFMNKVFDILRDTFGKIVCNSMIESDDRIVYKSSLYILDTIIVSSGKVSCFDLFEYPVAVSERGD